MRVLMVTNKVKTYALGFQNVIEPLKQLGHEVYWAADFSNFIGDKNQIDCKTRQIDIHSYPFSKTNIKALKQLKKIIKEDKIEAIQCSTPIGGALGRIAAFQCKVRHIMYTAHGFLFFKGAPLINRTIYKWEEQILSHITDVLITINPEDYRSAQKLNLRGKNKPFMVNGAGVRIGVSVNIDSDKKKKSIGIPENAKVVISAGELNVNKNNQVIIKALGHINRKDVYYVVCGIGSEEKKLRDLAYSNGINDNVIFLGYREDMPELMSMADIFVMPSFREGVPRSLLEAMDLRKPCIGAKTRGISDLIDEDKGGYTCNPKNYKEFANAILKLLDDSNLRHSMGVHNHDKARQYSYEIVRQQYINIYQKVLTEL